MCPQGQETFLDLEPKCRSSLRPSGEQGFCSPWIYLLAGGFFTTVAIWEAQYYHLGTL